MKKDITKDIKEIFNLCLLCGVAVAVVFHLNSALSVSDKPAQTKKQEVPTVPDSVKTVISKQTQKIR